MQLLDLIQRYALERDITPGYVYQLRLAAENFGRFIGHSPDTADLCDDLVNRWIVHLSDSGLSKRSVRSKRNHLLVLWRYADVCELADGPRRLRKVSCPKLIPDASPPDRVALLLSEAAKLTGVFRRSKVSRSAFWIAFILVVWETGLRLGDMLRLRKDHIKDGVLSIVQSKTGWPVVRPLSPQCLAAIGATEPEKRVRIFGDALSRGAVQEGIRRLLAAINLRGGTKRLRRSGATAAENAQRGSAMSYLGHQTPGLAYQFYVDPRLLGGDGRQSPPPLAG